MQLSHRRGISLRVDQSISAIAVTCRDVRKALLDEKGTCSEDQ